MYLSKLRAIFSLLVVLYKKLKFERLLNDTASPAEWLPAFSCNNLTLLRANKRNCSNIFRDSKGDLNGVSFSTQSQLFKVWNRNVASTMLQAMFETSIYFLKIQLRTILISRWVNTEFFLAKCNAIHFFSCTENLQSKMKNYVSVTNIRLLHRKFTKERESIFNKSYTWKLWNLTPGNYGVRVSILRKKTSKIIFPVTTFVDIYSRALILATTKLLTEIIFWLISYNVTNGIEHAVLGQTEITFIGPSAKSDDFRHKHTFQYFILFLLPSTSP